MPDPYSPTQPAIANYQGAFGQAAQIAATSSAPVAGWVDQYTLAPYGGGGGGSGTVTSVTATDASIVVSGTPTVAPTIATGTLDVIATQHPPAANWSNNSHKITSLANGSAAQDAAAFGQIPTALPPNGAAGGDLSGTYPNPTVAALQGHAVSATAPTNTQILQYSTGSSSWVPTSVSAGGVTSVTATDASIVVGGTGSAPTIATGTLDVIATQHPPAAAVAMNSQKITGLANGSGAQDACAFGQALILATGTTQTVTGVIKTNGGINTGGVTTGALPTLASLMPDIAGGSANTLTADQNTTGRDIRASIAVVQTTAATTTVAQLQISADGTDFIQVMKFSDTGATTGALNWQSVIPVPAGWWLKWNTLTNCTVGTGCYY